MNENEALPEGITGAMILDDAVAFSKQVVWMPDEMHDVLVLAAMASHTIDSFTTIFRILALSYAGESGKSTLLRTLMMLGWNPWKSKPTSYALRSRFNDREKPMVIIDEIGTIYGKDGMKTPPPEVDSMIKEGYEKNATFSISRQGVNEDLSCYCVAAFGGLRKAVPDDVWSRCIVFRMHAVPEGISLLDSLDDDTQALAKPHAQRMHQWARQNSEEISRTFKNFRAPHKKFRARMRQIWGSLYAVALVAGGDYPERFMSAFKMLALDASEEIILTGAQMVLRDTAKLFTSTGNQRMFAKDIMENLREISGIDLYETLSDRGFGMLMTEALGATQSMDIDNQRARGYHAKPVIAAWRNLEAILEPPDEQDEEADEFDTMFEVTEITEPVAAKSNGRARQPA